MGIAGGQGVEVDGGRVARAAMLASKRALPSVCLDVIGRKERGLGGLGNRLQVHDMHTVRWQHLGDNPAAGFRRSVGPDLEVHRGVQPHKERLEVLRLRALNARKHSKPLPTGNAAWLTATAARYAAKATPGVMLMIRRPLKRVGRTAWGASADDRRLAVHAKSAAMTASSVRRSR